VGATGTTDVVRLQNTATAANNSAAELLFAANRTTSGLTSVSAVAGMITDITQAAYKGALTFSTANNAAPAERMRIDYQGNLGIGTTSPTNLVSLDGQSARTIWMERNTTASTAGNSLTIQSSGANNGGANNSAGGDLILSSGISVGTGSSKIQFKTYDGTAGVAGVDNAASTAVTILGNTNVGIGTANTNPSYQLDVSGGTIRVASILSTSDARLKTHVRPIEGLELVRRLNGVRFDWIKTGEPDIGVIAQQVECVLPEAVSTDNQGYKSVKYQNLVAPLIESVKELSDENDRLKQQNADLEKRLEIVERALGIK
jgi:hypothetical protein